MKKTELSAAKYLTSYVFLLAQNWFPCGDASKQEMLFKRNGKIYDLSSADLTKLEEIEKKGLFLVN